MIKKLYTYLFLFFFIGTFLIEAQNKYLKFETSSGSPYTSGGGVSTYLYPLGLGANGFTGTSIDPESLRPYGINPNTFLVSGSMHALSVERRKQ